MAFQQGLSGLNAASKALDVVSNNIANAATVGFKGAQAQFADVYAASLGIGNASQVGIGAALTTVQQGFTQGNISNSTNPLDIAINGSGFFRLQASPTDQTVTYTRNGQFHLDANGYVINSTGNNLTGYAVVNGVTDRSQLVPVQLDTTGVVPKATGTGESNPGVVIQINLDDRDDKSLTAASPNNLSPWSANTTFPPNDLNTFNYSTPVTIYDQKGNSHQLLMYFTRVANTDGTAPAKNLWEVHYVLDDQDITDNIVAATSGRTGVPTLEFGANGKIVTTGFSTTAGMTMTDTVTADLTNGTPLAFSPDVTPGTVTVTNADGTVTYTEDVGFGGDYVVTATGITFPAGSAITDGQGLQVTYTTSSSAMASDYQFNLDVASLATDFPQFAEMFPEDIPLNFANSTLFGSGYDVNKLTQDGYAYGRLSGVSISDSGVLQGNYSNGQTKNIAQIVLVDFIAPTGLISLGNNQWAETAASGQPLVGDPGSGNRGVLQASAVEDANVDLTQELVNLITFQRNYQASAQSIKTQDQVMQTLVNLR